MSGIDLGHRAVRRDRHIRRDQMPRLARLSLPRDPTDECRRETAPSEIRIWSRDIQGPASAVAGIAAIAKYASPTPAQSTFPGTGIVLWLFASNVNEAP